MTDANNDSDDIVKLLLKDARLVIDYAVRVGRLPDDRLQKAVYAVESAASASVAQEGVITLTTALNNAISAIAPMTIINLRAGGNPFDPRNQRYILALQVIFCVLAIALTLCVAHMTDILQRQSTALNAIQQINEKNNFLNKVSALRKMLKVDEVLEKKDSTSFDQYQHSLVELRDLKDKLAALYALLSSAALGSWLPGRVDSYLANSSAYSPEDKSNLIAINKTPNEESQTQSRNAKSQSQNSDICAFNSKDYEIISMSKDYPQWLKQAMSNSLEEQCVTTKLGLITNFPPVHVVLFKAQADMASLNGWILPFLYGLLGAVVFVLRNLLDPRTPVMGFFPSIMRVALGGLAGIIIGWFWVPSAFKVGDIATITSIPFGLAFLAGFSIDILFSILDRLSRTVSEPAAQKTP